jgi:hypothetical protein
LENIIANVKNVALPYKVAILSYTTIRLQVNDLFITADGLYAVIMRVHNYMVCDLKSLHLQLLLRDFCVFWINNLNSQSSKTEVEKEFSVFVIL